MHHASTRYIAATATIYFPADEEVCCNLCPMMGAEILTGRKYCRRSGELLTHTEHQIGYDCPLNFENEVNPNG